MAHHQKRLTLLLGLSHEVNRPVCDDVCRVPRLPLRAARCDKFWVEVASVATQYSKVVEATGFVSWTLTQMPFPKDTGSITTEGADLLGNIGVESIDFTGKCMDEIDVVVHTSKNGGARRRAN